MLDVLPLCGNSQKIYSEPLNAKDRYIKLQIVKIVFLDDSTSDQSSSDLQWQSISVTRWFENYPRRNCLYAKRDVASWDPSTQLNNCSKLLMDGILPVTPFRRAKSLKQLWHIFHQDYCWKCCCAFAASRQLVKSWNHQIQQYVFIFVSVESRNKIVVAAASWVATNIFFLILSVARLFGYIVGLRKSTFLG